MNYFKFLPLGLFVLLITLGSTVIAEEGDTLIVQTIDWETPVLPGWNSPRSGIYQFPGDTINFSKILMHYTLKCDPSQNPACGEWDYTTHTHIREHTGVLDSNLYYHPNYLVNNISPDSFMYMNEESYYYKASLQYANHTDPTSTATIGEGGFLLNFNDTTTLIDGRTQFIYQSDELISGGLLQGEITALNLNVVAGNVDFRHFQIRIKNTSINSLPYDSLVDFGFTTVFKQHFSVEQGVNKFDFSFPFNWDGTSNILIDLSWSELSDSADFEADQIENQMATYTGVPDFFLDFEGWDYINVPAEVFTSIDSAITISFWQYGNPNVQPINSSILEAVDSVDNRVLNIHLPWGNGRVYWDAGYDDGNDRIDRSAGGSENYKGEWNFWTFTKDLRSSGMMRIFQNGQLWFQGSAKYRPMNGINSCRIGAAITYDGYYAGMIDDVRIWDTLVEWDILKEWMYKDIDSTHPNYQHLRAYYQFNEGGELFAKDYSPNGFDGYQFGYPEWLNYYGENRFRNGSFITVRPHISLENGDYNSALLDSIVVIDTFMSPPVNIVLFNPDEPQMPLDTLTKWPGYHDNYVYDAGGNAIDSTLVPPDGTIYHEDWPYYGEPYEIVIPWEIARFITPYGNGLSLGDGFTWVYDVTDYAPFLKDSVHITAGNFQELLDLKFLMIEGTPPREVKKIEKIYSGYWNLNNFSVTVSPDTLALIDDAITFKVKTRTSGHLFDNPTNCAEFCPKIHSLIVNNETVHEWQILQECSDNPLYPQGGTWIYDRAGWCPGAKVAEQNIEISPYIIGDIVIIDYESQADQYGAYSLEVQLFSYSDLNYLLDIGIVEIITPNALKRYGRFNPSGSDPLIVVQNLGRDTITSMLVEYGPNGTNKTYNWTGEMAFMEKDTIFLDSFEWDEWVAGNGSFIATLNKPNGLDDENEVNNHYTTNYTLPDVYPSTIVVHFKTNLRADQNTYQILNKDGLEIFEKSGFEPTTLYIDTITLINDCYDFYLWDSGDNGISFWANNEGNGYLRFYNIEGEQLKSFKGDFGDRIYHSFYTDLYLTTQAQTDNDFVFELIPNPSNGIFDIRYSSRSSSQAQIVIYNSKGQLVWSDMIEKAISGKIPVKLNNQPPGIYNCIIHHNNRQYYKKLTISY